MYIPCLKDIAEIFKSECYNRDYEFFSKNGIEPELYVFPQTWGSTALGFGGIGGQAMTSAYTTVVIDNNSGYVGVFFSSRLAYIIKEPNSLFTEDLSKQHMKDVTHKSLYIRKD